MKNYLIPIFAALSILSVANISVAKPGDEVIIDEPSPILDLMRKVKAAQVRYDAMLNKPRKMTYYNNLLNSHPHVVDWALFERDGDLHLLILPKGAKEPIIVIL